MVKVKIVQADGEVKFYEYASVDQTIVALGKLAAPKAPRKPRNDAGKERGPHATRAAPEPTPQPIAKSTVEDATVSTVGGVVENTAVVEKQADPASTANATAGTPTSTPSATAGATTLEAAQAAMEKVYKAKGVDTAKQILARLGTNRVKDILPASLGTFVKMATDIASFPEEQGTPAFGTKLQAYFAQSA
jgi:hypothetical protein